MLFLGNIKHFLSKLFTFFYNKNHTKIHLNKKENRTSGRVFVSRNNVKLASSISASLSDASSKSTSQRTRKKAFFGAVAKRFLQQKIVAKLYTKLFIFIVIVLVCYSYCIYAILNYQVKQYFKTNLAAISSEISLCNNIKKDNLGFNCEKQIYEKFYQHFPQTFKLTHKLVYENRKTLSNMNFLLDDISYKKTVSNRFIITIHNDLFEFYIELPSIEYIYLQFQLLKQLLPQVIVLAALLLFFAIFVAIKILLRPLNIVKAALNECANNEFNYFKKNTLKVSQDEIGVLVTFVKKHIEQLELKDQEKHEILRNISHELRSPLTRMQLSLALARNKSTGQAAAEHDRIERDVLRLNDHIAQIIQWSQLVASVAYKKRKLLSLDKIITEIIDDAKFEGEANGKPVILVKCEPCELLGLKDSLYSGIENIIRNALRFAEQETGVEVSLTTNKYQALVQVRDFGHGVANEALSHLFKPFFRAELAQGGDAVGSGLGMSIAFSAVKWHGGTIHAENANPGLLVSMSFPLQKIVNTNFPNG